MKGGEILMPGKEITRTWAETIYEVGYQLRNSEAKLLYRRTSDYGFAKDAVKEINARYGDGLACLWITEIKSKIIYSEGI